MTLGDKRYQRYARVRGLALHRQEYPGGPVWRGRHLAMVLPVVRRPRVLQSDNPVVGVWPVEGLEPLRTTRG